MLKNLNDQNLLTNISDLVKKEKRTTLEIMEYLIEIESRELHLKMGYSCLSDFCVRYLNYSEAEAWRRMQAAQATRKAPEVKELLSNNELSLTGLSLIAPHITSKNAVTLLPEVKNKTTRQIKNTIATHFPDAKKNKEVLFLEVDDELKELIEQAKKKVSEKDLNIVLKKALKEFLRKRPVRHSKVKKHTRYVQVALKKETFAHSNHQCEYRNPQGVRCNQTAYLQIDHVRPWAMGGSSHDPKNLRVLCKAHNLMLARAQFPLAREARSSVRVNAS